MIPLSSILTRAQHYLGRARGFPSPLNSMGVVIAQHIAEKNSAEITLNHTIIPSLLTIFLLVTEEGKEIDRKTTKEMVQTEQILNRNRKTMKNKLGQKKKHH